MPAKTALPSNAGNGIPSSSSTGLNLYVSQIPPTYNSSRLRDVFSTYGPIQSVKIMYDPVTNESRCFGFVLFERAADGHRAMMSMNGVLLDGSSGRLHVRVANPSALPASLRGGGDSASSGATEAPPHGSGPSSTAFPAYSSPPQQQQVYHAVPQIFAQTSTSMSPQQQQQQQEQPLCPASMTAQPALVTMESQPPHAVYCFSGPTAAPGLGQFVIPHAVTSSYPTGFTPMATVAPPNFTVAPVQQLGNVAAPPLAAWSPQPSVPTFYATQASPLVQVCLAPVQYVQQQASSHSSGQMESSLSTSGSSVASSGGPHPLPPLLQLGEDPVRYSLPWV